MRRPSKPRWATRSLQRPTLIPPRRLRAQFSRSAGVKSTASLRTTRPIATTASTQTFSTIRLDVIPKETKRGAAQNSLLTSDSSFHVTAELPPMTAATYYFRFYLARALEHAGMGDDCS